MHRRLIFNANVLPHLSSTKNKILYLSHIIGVLLNYLFLPKARTSLLYDKLLSRGKAAFRDKDFMGT